MQKMKSMNKKVFSSNLFWVTILPFILCIVTTNQAFSQSSTVPASVNPSVTPTAAPPSETMVGVDDLKYKIDDAYSMALFRVNHNGAGQFWGFFNDIEGTFEYEPDVALKFDFKVQTASVDCDHPELDVKLVDNKCLNVATFPAFTFQSISYEKKSEKDFLVTLNATIGAITKKIVIPFQCTGISEQQKRDRVGFEAEFVLNLRDYGLSFQIENGSGHDDVKIIISLEGFRIATPTINPPQLGNPKEVSKVTRPRLGLTPPGDIAKPTELERPVLVDKRGTRKSLSTESGDPSGTEFMGIQTKAKSIVFILDFSGSMVTVPIKMNQMLSELKMSINRLTDGSSFFIIFFDTEALLMPAAKLQNATNSNKKKFLDWADAESYGPQSGGGTDPSNSLALALNSLKPDAIYLLTDGGFDANASLAAINQNNPNHKTEINTVCFFDNTNEISMKQIASENHGTYRFIDAASGGDKYEIDDMFSNSLFRIQHKKAGEFWGCFNAMTGTFEYTNLVPSRFDFTAQVSTLDCNADFIEKRFLNANFLNAKKFQTISFQSTSGVQDGADKYLITGDFTLCGVTRSLTIPFECTGFAQTPTGRRAGFEGVVDIKLADYGIIEPAPTEFGKTAKIIFAIEGARLPAGPSGPVAYSPTGNFGPHTLNTGTPSPPSSAGNQPGNQPGNQSGSQAGNQPGNQAGNQSGGGSGGGQCKSCGKSSSSSSSNCQSCGSPKPKANTEFMGIRSDAKRVAFVLDFSQSMFGSVSGVNPKLDHMLLELKRTINRMPQNQEFFIVFFDDTELPMQPEQLMPASLPNKQKYFTWVDVASVGPDARGGTDPCSALEKTLVFVRPDAIFLLTDGGFDEQKALDVISRFNAQKQIQINTICFYESSNEPVMQLIAKENGGTYRYIAPIQP